MSFVTVKHKDGRQAEITFGEVAFYKSIGFKPVDGSVIEEGESDQEASASVQTPVSGTDQRLDILIDEIRGLRGDWAATFAAAEPIEIEPEDGETVELREPEKSEPAKSASEPDAPKNLEPDKGSTKPKK
jgi:hypothetical protein